jgi:hypothetical protein
MAENGQPFVTIMTSDMQITLDVLLMRRERNTIL